MATRKKRTKSKKIKKTGSPSPTGRRRKKPAPPSKRKASKRRRSIGAKKGRKRPARQRSRKRTSPKRKGKRYAARGGNPRPGDLPSETPRLGFSGIVARTSKTLAEREKTYRASYGNDLDQARWNDRVRAARRRGGHTDIKVIDFEAGKIVCRTTIVPDLPPKPSQNFLTRLYEEIYSPERMVDNGVVNLADIEREIAVIRGEPMNAYQYRLVAIRYRSGHETGDGPKHNPEWEISNKFTSYEEWPPRRDNCEDFYETAADSPVYRVMIVKTICVAKKKGKTSDRFSEGTQDD